MLADSRTVPRMRCERTAYDLTSPSTVKLEDVKLFVASYNGTKKMDRAAMPSLRIPDFHTSSVSHAT
jgi:hypothetical protein